MRLTPLIPPLRFVSSVGCAELRAVDETSGGRPESILAVKRLVTDADRGGLRLALIRPPTLVWARVGGSMGFVPLVGPETDRAVPHRLVLPRDPLTKRSVSAAAGDTARVGKAS